MHAKEYLRKVFLYMPHTFPELQRLPLSIANLKQKKNKLYDFPKAFQEA